MVTSEMSARAFYPGYPALLAARGWDVSLVCSSDGGLAEFAEAEGVRAFDLPMRRDPSPRRDLVSGWRAVGLLRRIRPEVLVVSTPKAALLGLLAGWITRVPVRIYQIWGLRHETESGARRALLTALERLAGRLATQVVANSRSLAAEVDASGISRAVVVLGLGSATGIDVDYFDPKLTDIPPVESAARSALRADVPTVGFVGRIHRDKGIDTLLAAAELFVRDGRPLDLLLVGPPENAELEERIRAMASPSLTVVRVPAVKDTRPYFLAMDVHCLPTRREGFPTVVLEASSLGVTTVTTDATGARDSVVDGVTGRIVPVDDAVRLAAVLEELADDPTERARLGAGARAWVVENFARAKVLDLQEKNLVAQVEARIS